MQFLCDLLDCVRIIWCWFFVFLLLFLFVHIFVLSSLLQFCFFVIISLILSVYIYYYCMPVLCLVLCFFLFDDHNKELLYFLCFVSVFAKILLLYATFACYLVIQIRYIVFSGPCLLLNVSDLLASCNFTVNIYDFGVYVY